MPAPDPFPCGGPGQPACKPTTAISVNPGDVIDVNGQKYQIPEDDQGEDEQE